MSTNKNAKNFNMWLLPIILMMGLVPVLVHSYAYSTNLAQFDWFPNNANDQTDLFFAWKMIAIIIVGIIMIAALLIHYLNKKEFVFENSFYFLMVYALFVVMSALFSNYQFWVSPGTYELFESVWVVIAYMVLCYYTYNCVTEEKQIYMIFRWSGIGMLIVTVIGVFQSLGLDFFKSSLGKHLIISSKWWGDLKDLTFNFPDKTAYTTLYNPNFLSFYFGMLIPLLLCLLIAVKQMWHRVVIVIAEVLCIVCLVGSRSSSGWMALAIGAVILGLVLLSRKKKWFVAGIAVVIAGIIVAGVMANTTGIGKSVKDTIAGTYHMKEQFSLNDIKTTDNDVELDIWNNPLYVSYEMKDDGEILISCHDADNNELTTTEVDQEKQISNINDDRFANVQIQPIMYSNDTAGMSVYVDGISWNFTKTDDDGYLYMNPAGKAIKFPKVKQSHLFNDDAMSKRGHIWNDTIPLLGKHVFMGAGANSYLFEYPQNDYISQAYVYGFNSYGVKAHSWYLQQWVETGLLGTLALLVFLFWYLVQSVRIYRRVDLHESISWVGFGIFAAVLVYLLVAIVNDSNVCTAPVFWGMLGLGLAVNRMLVKKENLFVKETVVSAESDTAVKQSIPKAAESAKADTAQTVQNTKGAGVTESSVRKKSSKKQSRKQRKNQK